MYCLQASYGNNDIVKNGQLFFWHHLTHDEEQGIYLEGERNLKSELVYITLIFVLVILA